MAWAVDVSCSFSSLTANMDWVALCQAHPGHGHLGYAEFLSENKALKLLVFPGCRGNCRASRIESDIVSGLLRF